MIKIEISKNLSFYLFLKPNIDYNDLNQKKNYKMMKFIIIYDNSESWSNMVYQITINYIRRKRSYRIS